MEGHEALAGRDMIHDPALLGLGDLPDGPVEHHQVVGLDLLGQQGVQVLVHPGDLELPGLLHGRLQNVADLDALVDLAPGQ
jgi:hypothetical protein